MKTKKRIFLFAFGVLFFVGTHAVNAQVTIGGETAPVAGATLDLSPSSGYVGGLKLPNVSLDDLVSIPNAFNDKSSGTIVATDLVGTMVYNTNATIGAGVYLWDGAKWQAMFSAGAGSLLNNIYPVGSIYMSIDPTDPKDIFGGVWAVWGEGRVPVGVASSGTFNSVEKTGGEETQALRAAIGAVNGDPSSIACQATYPIPGIRYMNGYGVAGSTVGTINITNHSTPVYLSTGEQPTTIQPYITCYMWKRTN